MYVKLEEVEKVLDWSTLQVSLNAISDKAKGRLVRRGQVYRCNFGYGVGSEMRKERPAVIIQNDLSNIRSGNTIVIPITHDNSTMSCMAPVTPQYDNFGKLILDGKANASNLMCVSKARLGDYICKLPTADMKAIDSALARTVDLMRYYADLSTQYRGKLNYITKVKGERNAAQDELSSIRAELGLSADESIIEAIKTLKAAARGA